MRCWRNQLIAEVVVLPQQSLGSMPFVKKPGDAILQLHVGRGAKGNLKDDDEDFADNMGPTSEHLSLKSKMGKKFSNDLNVILKTHSYVIETCKQLEGRRKFSISFDEADLVREKTLTATLSSHEKKLPAWLLPCGSSYRHFVVHRKQMLKRCRCLQTMHGSIRYPTMPSRGSGPPCGSSDGHSCDSS